MENGEATIYAQEGMGDGEVTIYVQEGMRGRRDDGIATHIQEGNTDIKGFCLYTSR